MTAAMGYPWRPAAPTLERGRQPGIWCVLMNLQMSKTHVTTERMSPVVPRRGNTQALILSI